MNRIKSLFAVIALATVFVLVTAQGQTRIDAKAYKEYFDARKGMTSEQLLQEFPAGKFQANAITHLPGAMYFDSINTQYKLTPYERELMSNHGFMVTERLSFDTYHHAFYDSYIKDLPLYISSDAMLHAFHRTYSNIMTDVEAKAFLPLVQRALTSALGYLRQHQDSSDSMDAQAIADVDVYLSVAYTLVHENPDQDLLTSPQSPMIRKVLTDVFLEKFGTLTAFTSVQRDYDYSQMKPRGRYTVSDDLMRYFRTLMWMGRTEIYITPPEGVDPPVPPADVERQCRMAVKLATVLRASGADTTLHLLERVLTSLIGEQDNLSTGSLVSIIESMNLTATSFSDPMVLKQFQNVVIDSGGGQQILSQILISSGSDQGILPAASYMVMGQRFLLDSYILGNVVFDKTSTLRMMPLPMDAMFVLGNNATAQLLLPEIDQFKYAQNLAALRFLTESLDTAYWGTSYYNSWLGAIRSLNPPSDRSTLPRFMRTAAWWQKTLNTQLTSWAELRHDNLLYGKQSYTGGLGCFYPRGFVEPVPEIFYRIAAGSELLNATITDIATYVGQQFLSEVYSMNVALQNTTSLATRLAKIAEKELAGVPLSSADTVVFSNWLFNGSWQMDCVKNFDGLYPSVFYNVTTQVGQQAPDFVIADVHTQPTDEAGSMVGRVLGVATGRVNMAAIVAEDPKDQCLTAYVGPVGSYYEHITHDFERLTDEEWATLYKGDGVARPSWVNVYLASKTGERMGMETPTLFVTSVDDDVSAAPPTTLLVAPNPTSSSVVITMVIPNAKSGPVSIIIRDAQGGEVVALPPSIMSEGNNHVRWDLRNNAGAFVPSGVYFVTASNSTWKASTKVVVRN